MAHVHGTMSVDSMNSESMSAGSMSVDSMSVESMSGGPLKEKCASPARTVNARKLSASLGPRQLR